MTWQEALEIVVLRTMHEPYRRLCSEDHPAHQTYRRLMIQLATESDAARAARLIAENPGPARGGCCG